MGSYFGDYCCADYLFSASREEDEQQRLRGRYLNQKKNKNKENVV